MKCRRKTGYHTNYVDSRSLLSQSITTNYLHSSIYPSILLILLFFFFFFRLHLALQSRVEYGHTYRLVHNNNKDIQFACNYQTNRYHPISRQVTRVYRTLSRPILGMYSRLLYIHNTYVALILQLFSFLHDRAKKCWFVAAAAAICCCCYSTRPTPISSVQLRGVPGEG